MAAGHRRVAFVNSVEDAPATHGRLEGYRSALEVHGIEFDEELVLTLGSHQECGWTAGEKLLAMDPRPTAVFCYNDRVAMGLYDALRTRGLEVPSDMAVVGFDNQEIIAGHLRPPLTTVALPHYDIGVRAVRASSVSRPNSPGNTASRHQLPDRQPGIGVTAMPSSSRRARTRRSISSRIGRTASTPWPAGSSRAQSS